MRTIILGAGAIGGTLGARLFLKGHPVVFVARGAHLATLRTEGLTFVTPHAKQVLPIFPVGAPEELELQPDDVLMLATKTQDSEALLDTWAARPVTGGGTAGERLALVSAQNGVENERLALRRFARVYGACVWLPALHVKPGEVAAYGTPRSGMLHLGRYPSGRDAFVEALAAQLDESGIQTHAVADVMRWKWAKLLANVGNAIEALCQPGPELDGLRQRVTEEGAAVLRAARIAWVSREEEAQARGGRVQSADIDGAPRGGGSSWQSLQRGLGSIEADFLNGEIVLLGRLHEIPTPINALLQRLANQAARERWSPGHLTAADLTEAL